MTAVPADLQRTEASLRATSTPTRKAVSKSIIMAT